MKKKYLSLKELEKTINLEEFTKDWCSDDALEFNLNETSQPLKHWYNLRTKQHIINTEITETKEIMLEEGFVEIYDCGQATYTWNK